MKEAKYATGDDQTGPPTPTPGHHLHHQLSPRHTDNDNENEPTNAHEGQRRPNESQRGLTRDNEGSRRPGTTKRTQTTQDASFVSYVRLFLKILRVFLLITNILLLY
jgi:hypothetical protein